ncbi:hypothetical protein BEL04_16715 [Mucilaginibacter sp. PPCGB 2223]|uniref:hypothetical protein n=1 Tax=Mucilaginibacter sp. PPCGB 2223 TaxID=1886027 RepID=UPI000826D0A1|nr:hypothetical protein [Mucilaginibacter sp. PPCGB 2223]OCX51660.1 hypothetical protein BEL04_16715 [Mucilaginibacter sp. PPCGB 2223]
MKRSTIIIITIIVITALSIGGYFMNGYSQRSTLKTALNIDELPASLKILDYSDQGVSSFRAEYELSVDPGQFNRLIQGRKYELRAASNDDLVRYATHPPGASFVPVALCIWGTAKNRVIIYTNISKSLVYVIWDEN